MSAFADTRRLGRWALHGVAGLAMAYLLTPLVAITWLAFWSQEIPTFPPEGYSLHWFAEALAQPKFVGGFLVSLQVGVVATAIGLLLGVPAGYGIAKAKANAEAAARRLAAHQQQQAGGLAVEAVHQLQELRLRPGPAQLLDDAEAHAAAAVHGHIVDVRRSL